MNRLKIFFLSLIVFSFSLASSVLASGGNKSQNWFPGGYYHFGSAVSNDVSTACAGSPSCIEVVGNNNINTGVVVGIENISSGAAAYSGINILNDLLGTNTTNYSGMWTNSSNYSDATFGFGNNFPNLMAMQNTMGDISIMASSTTFGTNSNIKFWTDGVDTTNQRMVINRTGLVGIATTTPWRTLSVTGTIGLDTTLTNAAGTPGSLCYNTTTFEMSKNNALTCTVSARDQKNSIIPLKVSALDIVAKLNPVSFKYNDDAKRTRWGFVADELQSVSSQLGDAYDKDGNARSIDIPALISLSIKAIQEQQKEIDELKARINK